MTAETPEDAGKGTRSQRVKQGWAASGDGQGDY
jgi:hypothetical protein